MMKITDIFIETVTIPLVTPFKTALRSITEIENILITVTTDSGLLGFGGAAPTAVITGDTLGSIVAGIEHIRANIVGMSLENAEQVFQTLNGCLIGNSSAKAAVDMALYDIIAKSLNVPLYRLLGGKVHEIDTDITISLDTPDKMVAETGEKLKGGYNVLKIKVGGDPELDIKRLQAVQDEAGADIKIRIDANQGWNAKEAVAVGRELQSRKLNIELMEQPVKARDFAGMKYVRDHLDMPVMADESIFSPQDALELVTMGAVDGLNIKLMKCGGIYNALKIAAIAETAGIPCMVGSMMESHLSVTAAAHFAVSHSIVKRFDLDAPLFCSMNPAVGGITYQGSRVCFSTNPGLGIEKLDI
ncbi:MAG: dipeptide epimerase [Patescibacteria group bacterium]|nr:dipeptide epimerase [Patescibacteria group bacterium]